MIYPMGQLLNESIAAGMGKVADGAKVYPMEQIFIVIQCVERNVLSFLLKNDIWISSLIMVKRKKGADFNRLFTSRKISALLQFRFIQLIRFWAAPF